MLCCSHTSAMHMYCSRNKIILGPLLTWVCSRIITSHRQIQTIQTMFPKMIKMIKIQQNHDLLSSMSSTCFVRVIRRYQCSYFKIKLRYKGGLSFQIIKLFSEQCTISLVVICMNMVPQCPIIPSSHNFKQKLGSCTYSYPSKNV